MLRKIRTLNKIYSINWTPEAVCSLFQNELIKAENLVQTNAKNNHVLVRELYLLACRASLKTTQQKSKEALLLRHYAKAIRQISNDYAVLFGRIIMTEKVNQDSEDSSNNCIDRLQARLFYLITQYSFHPCKHLAANIVNQLAQLCQHPHIELMPAQHYIYSQSLNLWRSRLIDGVLPKEKHQLH